LLVHFQFLIRLLFFITSCDRLYQSFFPGAADIKTLSSSDPDW
jgi:hypothetical protein